MKHRAVALNLVEVAAVPLDDPIERAEEAIQNGLILVWAEKLRYVRVVGYVDKPDADLRRNRVARDLTQVENRRDELLGKIEFFDLAWNRSSCCEETSAFAVPCATGAQPPLSCRPRSDY